MDKQLMTFTVNGETVQVAASPTKTLLEVLREELDLTGTKHGCELGHCGACTVLVGGVPILSCLALAIEMQGEAITTIEGMAEGNTLHPLQQAFAECGAAQCGYCTPGFLMSGKWLLDHNLTRWRATSAAAPAIPKSSKPSSWQRPACAPPPMPRRLASGEKGEDHDAHRQISAQDR
jgi:carbon-monoxide dehydrogenase small subunit